jgi:hypothetical protein
MISHSDDAKQLRACAEEMRVAAEEMLSDECRATALRLAEDYDRLARQAEASANHDREAHGGVA